MAGHGAESKHTEPWLGPVLVRAAVLGKSDDHCLPPGVWQRGPERCSDWPDVTQQGSQGAITGTQGTGPYALLSLELTAIVFITPRGRRGGPHLGPRLFSQHHVEKGRHILEG